MLSGYRLAVGGHLCRKSPSHWHIGLGFSLFFCKKSCMPTSTFAPQPTWTVLPDYNRQAHSEACTHTHVRLDTALSVKTHEQYTAVNMFASPLSDVKYRLSEKPQWCLQSGLCDLHACGHQANDAHIVGGQVFDNCQHRV